MTSTVGPSAQALAHLESLITRSELRPGDRLPTERQLAVDIGVSRSVIRNVLDSLEARGVVVRHVGRGTFVTPRATDETPVAEQPSPAEIMASRLAVEPQIAALAVRAATGEDLVAMHACLDEGERAGTSEDFEHWDCQLHHRVAVATHNAVLVQISRLLLDSRSAPVWGTLKKRTFNPDVRADYCAEHGAIVTAINDRDAVAARDAMRVHLVHVRQNLLGVDD